MAKILIKLVIDDVGEDASYTLTTTDGTSLTALISEAMGKAGWTSRKLTVTTVKVYNDANGQYVESQEAVENITVSNKQRFEIHFKGDKPALNTITADIFVNGTAQPDQQMFELNPTATVQDLLDAAFNHYDKASSGRSVKDVKKVDTDFGELVNLDKAYSAVNVEPGGKYSFSICFSPSVVTSNGVAQQDPPTTQHMQQPLTEADVKSSAATNTSTKSGIQVSLDDQITRHALGRMAEIGMLYDICTDNFINKSLFSSKLPQDAIITDKHAPKSDCNYYFQNSLSDKFKQLDVETDLKVSILGGLTRIDGHAEYIQFSDPTAHETATIICKVETMADTLNFNYAGILNAIQPINLTNCPEATHVVVGVQYGSVAVASLKYAGNANVKQVHMETSIKVIYEAMRTDGKGMAASTNATVQPRDIAHQLFLDQAMNSNNLPRDVDSLIAFMNKFPENVSYTNKGRGSVLCYTLLPLSAFKPYLENINLPNLTITPISNETAEEIIKTLDEVDNVKHELDSVFAFMQNFSFCIPNDVLERIRLLLENSRNNPAKIREDFRRAIANVRNGSASIHALYDITKSYEKQPYSATSVSAYMDSLKFLRGKITFIEAMNSNGAHYVGKGLSVDEQRRRLNAPECYILFCSWTRSDRLLENQQLFEHIVREKVSPCIIADLDMQPDLAIKENVPEGNRICSYSNGGYTSTDCIVEAMEEQNKCRIKCIENRKLPTNNNSICKKADANLICPQSLKSGHCLNKEHEWFCEECDEKLKYDFNRNFCCGCGFAPINTFQFRCSDPKHGNEFIAFDDNTLISHVDKITPGKELNILLLGETGVGKSTFINGFANYVTYNTFKEAEQGKQIYLVPSQFTITDGEYKEKTITVGKSDSESFTVGESCTQEPHSYVFNAGNRTIRLIDTPGIGDTRGAHMDDRNFAAILQYISHIKEIHGICILLKPNNARLNIVFKYCVNELLTHLHVSAAVNITFCFTNARSTFYRPGDTLPALNKFLDDLKAQRNVDITTNKGTIYCMDNESFRFLCCVQQGEKFTDEEYKNFEQSWTQSVRETNRLLDHFEKDVPAHSVGKTVSLNEARSLILTLSKPLADISQNIQDNIQVISEETKKVERLDLRSADLQKGLMIPQIGLEPKELGYPQTVCTGVNCIDTQTLPNTNVLKTIYRTICHDHCYLKDVQPETVPNPALQGCAAMDGNLTCKECGCSWEMHMHITFSQEKTTVMVEDPVTKQALHDTKSSREKQEILIKSLNDRVDKYKAEQARIDKICAKFGAFLKANAIVPYNDAIEEYLQFNIKEIDRQHEATKNPDLLQKSQRLKDQLKQYQEAKRVLDQMMVTGKEKPVEPSEIKKMQLELESLELTGKDIKKLFDATLNGTKTNFNYSEKYFDSTQYNKRPPKPYPPRLPPTTDRPIYANSPPMHMHGQSFDGSSFPSSHNAHNGFYDNPQQQQSFSYHQQQQRPYGNAVNYYDNSIRHDVPRDYYGNSLRSNLPIGSYYHTPSPQQGYQSGHHGVKSYHDNPRERQPKHKGYIRSWWDSLRS